MWLLSGEKLEEQKTQAQKQTISYLMNSARLIGQLYPVLVDKQGNVIDGEHRIKADPSWPTVEVQTVFSEEQKIVAKLVANVCRRNVSSTEKTTILRDLGRLYLKQGLKPSKLAMEISRKTGLTYRWVMKYIPSDFKMRPGLGGPKTRPKLCGNKRALLTTEEEKQELLHEPPEKVASITNYSNTEFATIILNRRFYLKLKEAASALDVNPNIILNNALLLTLRQVEKLAKLNCRKNVMVCVSN